MSFLDADSVIVAQQALLQAFWWLVVGINS